MSGLRETIGLRPAAAIVRSIRTACILTMAFLAASAHAASATPVAKLDGDGFAPFLGASQPWPKMELEARGAARLLPNQGHGYPVAHAAMTADGSHAASLSGDREVKIWDVASGRLIDTLLTDNADDTLSVVAFTPDGETVLAGNNRGELIVWDRLLGVQLDRRALQDGEITDVSVARDGRHWVTAARQPAGQTSERRTLHIFRVEDGVELDNTLPTGDYISARFLGDGKHILTVAAAGFQASIRIVTVEGATGPGWSVSDFSSWDKGRLAISRDGRKAAIMIRRTAVILDLTTGAARTTPEEIDPIDTVDFAPDGASLTGVTATGAVVRWKTETGALISRNKPAADAGRTYPVAIYGFRPDGKAFLARCADGRLRLVDPAVGKPVQTFGEEVTAINSIAWIGRGPNLITGGGTADIWNAETGARLRRLATGNDGVMVALPDKAGTRVSVGYRGLGFKSFLLDGDKALTGYVGTLEPLTPQEERDPISKALAQSTRRLLSQNFNFAGSDNGLLAAGARSDGIVDIVDMAKGTLLRKVKRTDVQTALAFAPDGRRLAMGSLETSKIDLLDVASGAVEGSFEGHSWAIRGLAFSADGKMLASASGDRTVRTWDVASRKPLQVMKGHNGVVRAVAFSADGARLVSGDSYGNVMLWSVADGKALATGRGHEGQVQAVAVAPDGRNFASVSVDGTVRLWSAANGELLATLISTRDGGWLAMTPEGFFTGSGGSGRILSIVQGDKVVGIDQVYDQLYRPDLVREKLAGDPNGIVRQVAARISLDKTLASGEPPEVAFGNAPAKVSSERLSLTAEIADRGGGIGRIEWRVNGVTLGLTERGIGRTDTGGAGSAPGAPVRKVSQEVTLAAGPNRIEVVAYNDGNVIASVPAAITIARDAPAPKGGGRLFVLAIGVNDYFDSRFALAFAVPDARAVADALTRAGGLHAAIETRLVLDQDVSAERLDAAFTDLSGRMRPEDTFVLFVAGHGKTVDGRYYYLPRDFRYRDQTSFATSGIGQDRFQGWLARIPAQRSVLLFDTCESGSLTGDRVAMRGIERAVAMEKMTAAMGRTTIAAASDDKPALEGYRGHGVFTYALLQGIGAADSNRDGKVDVLELIRYLDEAVPALSDKAFKFRQVPQAKFSGNNFALAAATAIVADSAAPAPDPARASSGNAATLAPPSASEARPTHVILGRADVLAAAGTGTVVTTLQPGSLVTAVRSENGWTFIARDGKPLGHVRDGLLARIQ